MWRPTNGQWWALLAVTLFVVFAWPPTNDKSLLVKFTNWVVDPGNRLPVLPGPIGFGTGDDVTAVEAHDLQTRMYDELYLQGGWIRKRLELKVARDPFNPATERQLLVGLEAVAVFLVWRLSSATRSR